MKLGAASEVLGVGSISVLRASSSDQDNLKIHSGKKTILGIKFTAALASWDTVTLP